MPGNLQLAIDGLERIATLFAAAPDVAAVLRRYQSIEQAIASADARVEEARGKAIESERKTAALDAAYRSRMDEIERDAGAKRDAIATECHRYKALLEQLQAEIAAAKQELADTKAQHQKLDERKRQILEALK
jgi:chromosome segregation ATPase